jgi:bifunctional enzyme CysN/CysC
MAELLRLATAGSVDDGKSTLIGRLLFDSKAIYEDQLEAIRRTSEQRGNPGTDLALLTDGLRAEREQGITIDVAYRYFSTPKRKFIIADTPGHAEYTRNMVTGASNAHLAMILIDARNGVVEQTRRHAFLSSLLGIPRMLVCINKMDLVDWDRDRFDEIQADFMDFAARLETREVAFIPISALLGDNVVNRSDNMPWYDGIPVLNHLESVYISGDENFVDPRFPVQYVLRSQPDDPIDFRGYAGTIASGVFRVGDEVAILPSGVSTTIASIITADGPVEEAFPPMAVTLTLADAVGVTRGDMICRPQNQPSLSHDIECTVSWMDAHHSLKVGSVYHLKHTTKVVRATVQEVHYRFDIHGLHRDEGANELSLNDIGRIRLHTTEPLAIDDYQSNRATGSFILIDRHTNGTVAAGTVKFAAQHAPSPNVVRYTGKLTREQRYELLGTRGATVLFTGLSGAGKSTIAAAVEELLVTRGQPAFMLDGDNLRHALCSDLGFSDRDRAENVRRAGEAARLFAQSGAVALVSMISPCAADRRRMRELHMDDGLPFMEVYMDTPIDLCEQRDPKGLYANARSGRIVDFTGIGASYEPPAEPDLVLTPESGEIFEQAVLVVDLIEEMEAASRP